MQKKYKHTRVGLLIGLLHFNILSSCLNTKQRLGFSVVGSIINSNANSCTSTASGLYCSSTILSKLDKDFGNNSYMFKNKVHEYDAIMKLALKKYMSKFSQKQIFESNNSFNSNSCKSKDRIGVCGKNIVQVSNEKYMARGKKPILNNKFGNATPTKLVQLFLRPTKPDSVNRQKTSLFNITT